MIGDIYSVVEGIPSNTALGTIKPTSNPARISSAQYGYSFAGWDKPDTYLIVSSISATGQWSKTLRSYKVRFMNPGDDEPLSSGLLVYGLSVADPLSVSSPIPVPEPVSPIAGKTYKFLGWDPQLTSSLSADQDYLASYSSEWQQLSVTFNDAYGHLADVSTTYGTQFGALSFPIARAKAGHSFSRWNKDSKLKITAHLTATAQYSPNSCQVTFAMMGHGNQTQPITANYGQLIQEPDAPSADGYQFHSWQYTSPTTRTQAQWNFSTLTAFGDIELSARWEPRQYQVILTPKDGISQIKYKSDVSQASYQTTNTAKTIAVKFGTEWSAYAIPQPGFTYVTYTAAHPLVRKMGTETQRYSPAAGTETHIVKFYKTKDSSDAYSVKEAVDYGATIGEIKPANPTRDQSLSCTYEFSRWDQADSIKVIKDMNIYGVWNETLRSFDIAFKNNNASILSSGTLQYGTIPTYSGPTPEKQPSGSIARFKGWNPALSPVTKSTEYTASYNDQATVTFYDYDQTTVISASTIDIGSTFANVLKPIASRIGWTFDRWSRNSDLIIVNDITAYAMYTINTYQLKFDNQGHGNQIAAQSIQYGSKAIQPIDPTALGYTFRKWFKERECLNQWDFNNDVIGAHDTILYAKWSVDQYPLKLQLGRGIREIQWKKQHDSFWTPALVDTTVQLDYGTQVLVFANAKDHYMYSAETQSSPKSMTMGIYGLAYSPAAAGNLYSVTCSGTHCTVSASSTGRYDETLRISWTPTSNSNYVYFLKSVKVFAGSSASGTLLATYTSGTAADFTMSGSFYSSIYVVGEYEQKPNSYVVSLHAIGSQSGLVYNQTSFFEWTCPEAGTVSITAYLNVNISSCGTKKAREINYMKAGSAAWTTLVSMSTKGSYSTSVFCNPGDKIQITGYCSKSHATEYTLYGPLSNATTGAGTYSYGATATLRAIGSNFQKWSDNAKTTTRTLTVDQNVSLTAYFS